MTPEFDPNDPTTYYSNEFAVAPGFYNYVGGDFDSRSSENQFHDLRVELGYDG